MAAAMSRRKTSRPSAWTCSAIALPSPTKPKPRRKPAKRSSRKSLMNCRCRDSKRFMEDFMTILKNEFDAGEGSFLIKLRPNLEWDKDAFNRLVNAMKLCAESKANEPKL